MGEVGFRRATLLDQFMLTRHVPPRLFGSASIQIRRLS
jgi:hypothetical protein